MGTNRHDSDCIIIDGYMANNIHFAENGETWFVMTEPNGAKYNTYCSEGATVEETMRLHIDEDKLYDALMRDTLKMKEKTSPIPSIDDESEQELWENTINDYIDKYEDGEKLFYTDRIAFACDELKELLISKNEKYGNSMFKPITIFGQDIPAETAILARIQDKLSRLDTIGLYGDNEDVILDLMGYLIGLKIVLEINKDLDE